ncbi:hypothetical protein [Oscillatoria salina]
MTGILSAGATLTLPDLAAGFVSSSQASEYLAQNSVGSELPRLVGSRVLRQASQDLGVSVDRLEIANAEKRTWSNGCLGLAKPNELCTQALVEGWRVTVTNGEQKFIYRTNSEGSNIRLETGNSPISNLPRSVAQAVLENAARKWNVSSSALRIVEAEKQTWNNGCLGLAQPGEGCTEALVEGWRVTVARGEQKLVYRTNDDGSNIRLETANSPVSNLPRSVERAVLANAARQWNVPSSALRIVEAEKQTWSDSCLGLGRANESCLQVLVEGWRVTVARGEQKLVYRTNDDGSNIRLETANSPVSNLPRSVERAVLANAARQWNVPSSALRIVEAEKQTWSDSCLGLGRANESCLQVLVEGWRVTVARGEQKLVYRTNDDGSNIRLETENTPISNAPRRVINTVLEDAAEKLEVPTSYLRIVSAEKRTWGDRCLGIPNPLALCAPAIVEGWQVTVDVGDQIWVYRTDERADLVKVENPYASEDIFSRSLAEAVLRQASQKSGLPMSQLRIVESSRHTWDGCYGIYIDRRACPEIGIPGWRVIIASENGQKLVYHTDLNGSEIRFNPIDSELGSVNEVKPVRIPTSELPESLPRNVIFRTVSSGGFAGRTSETILYTNGRLVRNQLGGNGTILSTEADSISRQQIREFQRLLQQQNFAQFNRLSYPAPRGSADFITVTLIGRDSVTSYVDFNQDRLPLSLQNVVKSWNELSGGI